MTAGPSECESCERHAMMLEEVAQDEVHRRAMAAYARGVAG